MISTTHYRDGDFNATAMATGNASVTAGGHIAATAADHLAAAIGAGIGTKTTNHSGVILPFGEDLYGDVSNPFPPAATAGAFFTGGPTPYAAAGIGDICAFLHTTFVTNAISFSQHFKDPLLFLIFPYMIGQPLFRAYVQKTNVYEKNKQACKWIMCVYNLILAVFSFWSCVHMVYVMATELPHGVYGVGHYTSSMYGWISYFFYLSKYVEFLDTYFLILCNRPVIWLQYLHHIGAPIDLAVWHNNQVEGTWIYVVFNGFIHTVMYYYYACCIMKWPFPWKQMITNLQLLQFVSGLCVVVPYAFNEDFWAVDAKRAAFFFNYAYVLMNLTLFINFYRQTYLLKKKNKAKAANAGADTTTAASIQDDKTAKKGKTPEATMTIFYKGIPINITPEWQRKHPGGVKVLKIFHMRDATDVMLGMHSDQGRALIESMAKGSAETSAFEKFEHTPSLYEKLWTAARAQNLFHAEPLDEFRKAFYSFAFVFGGFYFACTAGITGGFQQWGGLLSMAFGWYQLGWLGHDWSHHTCLPRSTTKCCKVNDWMAWALTIVRPTSLLSWKLRHNTHHAVTNELGNDPDIKLSPILHFFEDFDPSGLTGMQHLYFLPLVGFVPLIYWHIESWMASSYHWNSKNLATRAHARWDVLAMLLHYLLFLGPLTYFLCAVSGVGYGLCQVFCAYYLSGLWSGVVVFASHYGEERLTVEDFETISVRKKKGTDATAETAKIHRIGLLQETARTVRNIQSFSRTGFEEDCWFWLTGGLNTQFEHHLFPLMPRCNLRKMTPLIKHVCAEHEIRFAEDNLKDCVQICFDLLKDNVTRNLKRIAGTTASVAPSSKQGIMEQQAAAAEEVDGKNAAVSKSRPVHTETSFRQSTNILLKAISLLGLGYLFCSQAENALLVTFGIFLSCIGFYGFDCVRSDCLQNCFSPSQTLNKLLSALLSGKGLASLATVGTGLAIGGQIYANTFSISAADAASNESETPVWQTVLFSLNYFMIPLVVMRLNNLSRNYSGSSSDEEAAESSDTEGSGLRRSASVDRLAPGFSTKLERWAKILDRATRPDRNGGALGGGAPVDGTNVNRLAASSPLHAGLPFARDRLADIPMYRVKNWISAVEKDLNNCLGEQLKSLDLFDGNNYADAAGKTLSGLEVLGDLSPAFSNAVGRGGSNKKNISTPAGATFPSSLRNSASNESVATSAAGSDNGDDTSCSASCATDADSEQTVFLEHTDGLGSTGAGNDSISTDDDGSGDATLGSNPAFLQELLQELDPELSPRTAASAARKKNQTGSEFAVELLCGVVQVLLSPIQLAFQKIFFSGDLEFYSVVGIFLAMVYVGSFYFAYTPVCILFALLGPKTAGPKFLERKFAEFEAAIAGELASSTGSDVVDAGTASKSKRKSSSGIYLFGHRLNIFMCLYIGLMHLLAFHAIFLLLATGGKDVLLELADGTFRSFLHHGGLLASADIPADQAPTTVHWQTLFFAFILWPISGLGITAGAHRLWSHRSYDAHAITRFLLMIANSIANQGSIYHWARDHRTHHINSDTESDPHDSNRGWFYAHMGWLLVEKPEKVRLAGRKVDVQDLQKDALVMFQKKTDPWWNFAWCFAVPAFVSVFGWGETLWNGFLYAGVLRYVYVLHCTWSVNSIVHTDFGPSPYDPSEPPSESRLVSFLAMGEGWHSWHHAFAYDYATAELDCLQQWNPTKIFIDLMAVLGLVKNRKRGHRMWGNRKKQMRDAAEKEGKVLVETLSGPPLCRVRNIRTMPVGNKSGVSAGELDAIVDIKEWEQKTGLTKEILMNAIPDRLKKRSALKSSLYLCRDIVYCGAIYYTARFLLAENDQGTSNVFVNGIRHLLATSTVFSIAFYSTYAFLMGSAMTGVWVVGHECGHGAFSESSKINDFVGFFTHTVLLVPYFAWQFTHAKHHKYTNHLTLGETHVPAARATWLHKLTASMRHVPGAENATTLLDCILHLLFGWPLYLFTNLTGGRTNWRGQKLNKKKNITHFYASNSEIFPPQWHFRVNLSGVGIIAMALILAYWAKHAANGWHTVAVYYFLPYLVTNGWLVLYTWLQHTHADVPHLGVDAFNWLRGALCTIDRPYPWFFDHMHHSIGSTHVMHHLNFKIPHYHAAEATECVKPLLGDLYRYDPRGITEVLFNVTRTCEHVDGIEGVQFFRAAGIASSIRTSERKSGIAMLPIGKVDAPEPVELKEEDAAPKTPSVTKRNSVSRMVRSPTTGMLHPVEFPTEDGAPVMENRDDVTGRMSNDDDVATNKSSKTLLLHDEQHMGMGYVGKSSQEDDILLVGKAAATPVPAPTAASDTNKMEIMIDGKIVDVTNYVKKHPGGRILEFMKNTDATDAFSQFHHRSERAKKVLRSLPKRDCVDELERDQFMNVGNQALLADIRKLEAELDAEGYFKPSPLHAAYRVAEIIMMHAVGGALLYVSSCCWEDSAWIGYATLVAGFVTLGIVQGRCGWLQHEGGHYSLTGFMKLDKLLQQVIYGVGCGMAASWWSNQHNKHHATPQKVNHDVDLNTLPLVAFHTGAVTDTKMGQKLVRADAGKKSNKLSTWAKVWLQNQMYLFSPLICLLVALFWQLYLHPRHAIRSGNYIEVVMMGLRYATFFSFFLATLNWSVTGAVVFYVMYVQAGASYIFTNFAVSHTHLPTVAETEHRNWAEYAADHTMNCDSHLLTNWWMSYLNFQIEHHLWPQMPQFRFPQVSKRVRAVFEKHAVEYKSLPYWDAIAITMKNLDDVAKEAMEMTMADTSDTAMKSK
mmetsp:Transcript_4546/g.11090  ORF Transcript_4546/g.11090 Transcript_4546/m.11090 type:complete len:2751 (-) Transcript_4546:1570-9822(-)